MAPIHVIKSRTHDFLYDPTFLVPTKQDYARYVRKATIISAKRDIAPIFSSMFTNSLHQPRQRIVLRKDPVIKDDLITNWVDPKTCGAKDTSVVPGADKLKFFRSPIIKLSPGMISEPKQLPKIKLLPFEGSTEPRDRGTQTIYRESSAQTMPWKPKDYTIIDNSDPEILMLDFLKEDLPPGMHEVEIIKRLRRKRGWMKQLPEMDTSAGVEKRRQILEAIETDEWVFREEEIADLQSLRLELVEKMLQEILDQSNTRGQQKLLRVSQRLEKKRSEKLATMHRQHSRELRRLYRNHKGIILKYYEVNVITEHADYTSELYAPLGRFGSHPRNWHQKEPFRYLPKLHDIEKISTLPKWLPKDKVVKENPIILPGRRLCIRETKWTDPILKELYRELKSMNTTKTFKCTLRKRIVKQDVLDETAYFDTMYNTHKYGMEPILLLQSVIRGRATQSLIFEGRDKCRELIQELQCTHALVQANTDEINQKRFEVKNQQRIVQLFANKEANLAQSLNKLKGTIVGTMLDYLNKELIRLLDERKAHAIAMVYERERRDREAAEAGRRQLEERRRMEHDEIFKQIVKVHHDTVDLYLNDIISEGVEHVSEETAQEYVKKIAQKIDKDLSFDPDDFLAKEEIVADMVCNFLIPEVEKSKVRELIRKKQKKTLHTVHDSIYNKIEDLPNKSSEGMSSHDN